MSIRRDPIYISSDVWRSCLLLARAQSDEMETSKQTADSVADNLLRQTLKDKYPQLFEHQKKIDALEKEMIKTLGAP